MIVPPVARDLLIGRNPQHTTQTHGQAADHARFEVNGRLHDEFLQLPLTHRESLNDLVPATQTKPNRMGPASVDRYALLASRRAAKKSHRNDQSLRDLRK